MSIQHSICDGSTSPDVYIGYGIEVPRKDVVILTVHNRHYIDAAPPSTNAPEHNKGQCNRPIVCHSAIAHTRTRHYTRPLMHVRALTSEDYHRDSVTAVDSTVHPGKVLHSTSVFFSSLR